MAGAAVNAGSVIASVMRGGGFGPRLNVPQHLRNSAKSVEFACRWYCTQCGFLAEQDPQRAPPNQCPCCGSGGWADLRQGAIVEALAEVDDERREVHEQGRSGVLWFIPGGLFSAGALYGLAALVVELFSLDAKIGEGFVISAVMSLMPVVVFGAAGAVFIRRGLGAWANVQRPRHPTRWHYPWFRSRKFASRRRGPAAGQPTLVSPLTQTPCLAYELGVRIDDVEPEAPWSWSLVEQRVGAIEIDGRPLPDRVLLQVTPVPVQRPATDHPDAAHVDRALRERGLDPERLGYSLYETVLCPGDVVEGRITRMGCVLTVSASP